jgi:hypothetical protein
MIYVYYQLYGNGTCFDNHDDSAGDDDADGDADDHVDYGGDG